MSFRSILNFIRRVFRLEKVLFADLDGTIIITKSGKTFPEDCKDWQFKPYVLHALRNYNPTHLHIVTNQGGIEKGFVKELEFIAKMEDICAQLQECLPDTRITFDYCIGNDPNDKFRKPNSGMIDLYCNDAVSGTDCDKRNCLMIGDASGLEGQFSDSDKRCAENAGVEYMDIEDFIDLELHGCDYCQKYNIPCHAGESLYEGHLPCK